MKEFVEFIAKHLVDNPANVSLEMANPDEKTIELTLKVGAEDVGKVIGKQGKTAQAMRTLLTAIAAKEGKRAILKILDQSLYFYFVIDFFLIAEVKVVADTSGYVSVLPFSDFPDQFGRLKKVYIDVFGAKRIFFTEDAYVEGGKIFMKFKNIDSGKDASYLVGCKIYIDKASAVKLDEDTFYIHDLVGSEVVFGGEFFGTLIDVMRLPANDVYVIQHKDGKEILIPAVKEFIDSFDDNKKQLILTKACEIFLNDED